MGRPARPGVHDAKARVHGEPVEGYWFNRSCFLREARLFLPEGLQTSRDARGFRPRGLLKSPEAPPFRAGCDHTAAEARAFRRRRVLSMFGAFLFPCSGTPPQVTWSLSSRVRVLCHWGQGLFLPASRVSATGHVDPFLRHPRPPSPGGDLPEKALAADDSYRIAVLCLAQGVAEPAALGVGGGEVSAHDPSQKLVNLGKSGMLTNISSC